jgi:hypothetical protein
MKSPKKFPYELNVLKDGKFVTSFTFPDPNLLDIEDDSFHDRLSELEGFFLTGVKSDEHVMDVDQEDEPEPGGSIIGGLISLFLMIGTSFLGALLALHMVH